MLFNNENIGFAEALSGLDVSCLTMSEHFCFYLSFMTLMSTQRHEEFRLAYINGLMQLPESFLSVRLIRMEHGTLLQSKPHLGIGI